MGKGLLVAALKNSYFRILLLIVSPLLGGLVAFLGTFAVSALLHLTFLPGIGEVGWVFCFITIPVGMIAAPFIVARYLKKYPYT